MTLPSPFPAARTPARVWVGLVLAIGLDVPVQLIWKALMVKYGDVYFRTHDLLHVVQWFTHQARTWILLGLFVCQFVDWIWVLGNADLSFAQPFTALSYAAVSFGAVLRFHEHVSPGRIIGIGLILAGVVLIGSTGHRTTEPPA